MTYTYKTKGTCSTNIELEVEDGIVRNIAFWGENPCNPRNPCLKNHQVYFNHSLSETL